MNKIYQMNGYQLHLISSKKFKDITISVRFKGRFTRETVTSRSVLGFLMITGTMKHPTQKDLSRTLEDLYGANLSANISSAGKGHIITFKNTCVNQEFLPIDENLLIKQVDLLNELVNDGMLGAITLMIAESKPEEKDVMVKLIMNLLKL